MRRTRTTGWIRGAALAVALAVGGLPSGVRAENLADALSGAYNNSGLLQQNRALLRAADEDVALAVSALRPVINWTLRTARRLNETGLANVTTTSQRTNFFMGLTADWLIYDGGGRRLSVQASKETVLGTRQALISIEQLVLLRAARAYVDVLLQIENVTLRENNVRVLQEELRAAQDRFDVGEVTRTDVALAQSRLAAARSNLAAAQGLRQSAEAEYINAVGRSPGTLAPMPPLPPRASSVPAAQAVAARNHPDILAAQHQVTTAELNVQVARKALGPSASIQADVGMTEFRNETSYNRDASIGLSLTQPIYQGGRLAANVRRAMAARDAARGNLLTVQRDVLQDVNDAFVRFETARASLAATGERVRAAQVAFDGIREEATLGARTTLDVLAAEQELLDALTVQISDRSEEQIAAYQLLSAQGLLTAERLKLAVQIYDPTIYYRLSKDAPAAVSKRSRDLDRVLEALGKK